MYVADSVLMLMEHITFFVLQGYDNSESRVRKASVFCLVAIYLVVGEELRPYLSELSGSKVSQCNCFCGNRIWP